MNKVKSIPMFLLAVAFLSGTVMHAESNKHVKAKRVIQKAVSVQSKDKVEPANTPQTPALPGAKQGYQMVIDVLDGFGGESESDNYRIPVNSGGQPSPVGTSESDNWGAKAGFVYTSRVKHGDANADGALDLGDAIYILNYLFKSGPDPCPMEAGDANSDGIIDLGDAIYVLNYLFKGGPSPSC